ncbi:MAG: hypothetical protein EBR02_10280, partial [Alphaproteobacteria bacterium]|nr:hypothetical protein [Alphaproteobacteria bacterium]
MKSPVFTPPAYECDLCPRLCGFHAANRKAYPSFFNGPVPAFGSLNAKLLVVGLAPGLKGANQTGRPFTGDYAGLVLYSALLKNGLTKGHYNPASFISHPGEGRDPCLGLGDEFIVDPGLRRDDTLSLVDCRITNAVRCVPPENKPEPSEIKNCNAFLKAEIAAMPNLQVILSLGLVSHNAVLKALGLKASAAKFTHGAAHY